MSGPLVSTTYTGVLSSSRTIVTSGLSARTLVSAISSASALVMPQASRSVGKIHRPSPELNAAYMFGTEVSMSDAAGIVLATASDTSRTERSPMTSAKGAAAAIGTAGVDGSTVISDALTASSSSSVC